MPKTPRRQQQKTSELAAHPKTIESRYQTSLRAIAREVGKIIHDGYDGSNDSVLEIMDRLDQYSEIIDGWAETVATNMVTAVNRQDEKVWRQRSQLISQELRNVINNTPTGHVMQSLVREQVQYITSLPLEAADRVYDIQKKAI